MEDDVIDENVFRQAVFEHATFLGMDPEKDKDFLWIAEEALRAPLPENWRQGEGPDGSPYYYNVATGESVWDHPSDESYRQMFAKHKKEAMEKQRKQKLSPEKPRKKPSELSPASKMMSMMKGSLAAEPEPVAEIFPKAADRRPQTAAPAKSDAQRVPEEGPRPKTAPKLKADVAEFFADVDMSDGSVLDEESVSTDEEELLAGLSGKFGGFKSGRPAPKKTVVEATTTIKRTNSEHKTGSAVVKSSSSIPEPAPAEENESNDLLSDLSFGSNMFDDDASPIKAQRQIADKKTIVAPSSDDEDALIGSPLAISSQAKEEDTSVLNTQIESLKTDLALMKKQRNEMRLKLTEARKEVSSLQSSLQKLDSASKVQSEDELVRCRTELQATSEELGSVRAELMAALSDKKRAVEEMRQAVSNSSSDESRKKHYIDLEKECDGVKAQVQQLSDSKRDLEEQYQALEQKQQNRIAELHRDLDMARDQANRGQETAATLSREKHQLEEELAQSLAVKETDSDKFVERITSLELDLEASMRQLKESERKLRNFEFDSEQYQKDKLALQKRAESQEAKVDELSRALRAAESQLESVSAELHRVKKTGIHDSDEYRMLREAHDQFAADNASLKERVASLSRERLSRETTLQDEIDLALRNRELELTRSFDSKTRQMARERSELLAKAESADAAARRARIEMESKTKTAQIDVEVLREEFERRIALLTSSLESVQTDRDAKSEALAIANARSRKAESTLRSKMREFAEMEQQNVRLQARLSEVRADERIVTLTEERDVLQRSVEQLRAEMSGKVSEFNRLVGLAAPVDNGSFQSRVLKERMEMIQMQHEKQLANVTEDANNASIKKWRDQALSEATRAEKAERAAVRAEKEAIASLRKAEAENRAEMRQQHAKEEAMAMSARRDAESLQATINSLRQQLATITSSHSHLQAQLAGVLHSESVVMSPSRPAVYSPPPPPPAKPAQSDQIHSLEMQLSVLHSKCKSILQETPKREKGRASSHMSPNELTQTFIGAFSPLPPTPQLGRTREGHSVMEDPHGLSDRSVRILRDLDLSDITRSALVHRHGGDDDDVVLSSRARRNDANVSAVSIESAPKTTRGSQGFEFGESGLDDSAWYRPNYWKSAYAAQT